MTLPVQATKPSHIMETTVYFLLSSTNESRLRDKLG